MVSISQCHPLTTAIDQDECDQDQWHVIIISKTCGTVKFE